jgi:hypothetical protein
MRAHLIMARLQQQLARERPDTFSQAASDSRAKDLATPGRTIHFDNSSFNAALSSIDSAKSFFGLRLSSSSSRSRLASDTSRPPYLAFQLYSVASETPCLLARSAVFALASCSRRTAMICSSVNLTRFIGRSHDHIYIGKNTTIIGFVDGTVKFHSINSVVEGPTLPILDTAITREVG